MLKGSLSGARYRWQPTGLLGLSAGAIVVAVATGQHNRPAGLGPFLGLAFRRFLAGPYRLSMSSSPAAVSDRTLTPAYGERAIAEADLICFDNPRPGRAYEISIELPEFTCKCPFSGYPDFAVLRLIYQPGPRVVELKAIKLYVNSYRDRAISHEEVTNRILDDLVAATEPQWMQLEADFHPRGNVHTVVRVSHGSRLAC